MKELSVEEKAKAYDEAIEKSKEFYILCKKCGAKDTVDFLEDTFPELAESEDEKIREMLIRIYKKADMGGEIFGEGITYKQVIAWLEKQGEKKPFDYKNANIQQKDFAPKIEPKFKIGDWVIDKQGIVHQIANVIENVTCHTYGYDIVGGGYFNDNTEGVRLWTIQDAKDGDVLIDKSNGKECPFIFKTTKPSDIKTDILNPLAVLGYCGIGGAGFTKGNGWGDTANCIYYPATKEQRDLLFQKMQEAGYMWDTEKKELKNIHVIDEGKTEMDYCFTKMMNGEKVSSTWSEEDEEILRTIISDGLRGAEFDMLQINWLKSLKQRIGWKPSEDQMKALAWALSLAKNCGEECAFDLRTLYEQLEKLKG